MKLWQSKVGWACAGLYLAAAVFLVQLVVLNIDPSEGLFSQNFRNVSVVVLGWPWSSLLFALIDHYFPSMRGPLYRVVQYCYLFFPIIFNISLVYLIGLGIERLFRYLQPRVYRKDRT